MNGVTTCLALRLVPSAFLAVSMSRITLLAKLLQCPTDVVSLKLLAMRKRTPLLPVRLKTMVLGQPRPLNSIRSRE